MSQMHKFPNNSFKKIYVLHTAFLGDIFISYFFLDKLKQINPDSKVSLITTPEMEEPSKLIDCIDEVLVFDKRNSQKKIINAKKFGERFPNDSLIISLHKSLRSSILAFYANSKNKIIWDNASLSSLFKNKAKYKFHKNEKDRLNQFLDFFEDNAWINRRPKVNLDSIKIDPNLENAILLFPGSVWETKKWKPYHFSELANVLTNLGYEVLLCGSKNEIELCNEIAEYTNVINMAGKFSLIETIKLVSEAKYLVCNDSAPTHIADLLGTPKLSIFGPTSPIFGFSPNKDETIYLNKTCSPCNIHGPRVCPLGHHKCMDDISPQMVFNIIKNYIK